MCLAILDNSGAARRSGPWFVRDYGMAMFNATMEEAIELREGEVWTAALPVTAYEGALTTAPVRHWSSRLYCN